MRNIPCRVHMLCIALLLLPCAYIFAQQSPITVNGVVKSEKGEPLPNFSIRIKGTNKGTVTDTSGHFTLAQVLPNAVLQISGLNYEPATISINGKVSVSVTLKESNSNLGETVVIGYQRISRKASTAAISSISGKELENIPMASFDQLMQGRLSGVNVQNFSGDPAAKAAVSVRGSSLVSSSWDENNVVSSPLYVVDGVPQSNEEYVTPGAGTGMNYLGGVNPNDIASIDVLKDASAAAIYGSRAANGVILITTKKGRSGAPKVIFSGYGGITEKPKLREVTLGAEERRQKLEVLMQQLDINAQRQLPYLLTDSLNPAFNGNTDWQGLFYRPGIIKSGDINLSGGGDGGTTYRFSTGYYDEQGILKATGYKRYTTRLNLFSKALKGKLEINPVIYFSRADRARGGEGADPRYVNYNPFSLNAGTMPSSLFNLSEAKKEAILSTYNQSLDKNLANTFGFNLNLGYTFDPHFKFNSLSAYQYTTSRRDFNRSSAMENSLGNYSYTFDDYSVNLLTSNYFSYNNAWGQHNLSAVAGQDIQYNVYESTTASGSQGSSDNVMVVRGFTQKNLFASSDYQAHGLLSYYSRLSYDFDTRYLFSFAGRWDGSSRFGTNNKWGFFPSASVGWIVSDEAFMRDRTYFSLIKLRGSLGTSGSEPQYNYLQYNLYNINAGYYNGNGTAASYNGTTAITPNFYDGAAQKNLSWEKSKQWNVGVDLEIQKGKYSASVDLYNKESSLQLFSVNLPVTSGYTKALTNSIGVRNAGVELTIAANPLPASSPIKWFSRLNISYNRNRIMSLPNGGRDLVMDGDRFDKSHILSVGSPINAFYLYKTLGVFSTDADVPVNKYNGQKYRNSNGTYTAGDFYLADLDGDGFIDIFNSGINPDKMPIGDPNPRIVGGWSNNFTWKNFTLGLFFNFVFKRDVLNLYQADQFSNSTAGDPYNNFVQYSTPNLDKLNIWRKAGDRATYAKYDLGTYLYYYTSAQTFFLTPGDYIRLKSANLYYTVPSSLTSKWKVDQLKFFFVADNLTKWQASKELPDAENVNSYGEYNGNGYPIPKKFTLGFQLFF